MLTIARLTLLEARQRKLLWAITLMGIALLALFAIGFYFLNLEIQREVQAEGRDPENALFELNNVFLLIGLYAINFLVVILAVLTSVDTIAGEVASGTIHTVVTKPLRRWEVVLGKWLGLGGMLGAFIVIMSTAMIGIVWTISGYLPPNPAQGIALIVVEGLVILTLSILGGTRFSTLTNGVFVFMLYGVAFISGWIEQIGAFTRNETAVNIGIIASLIIPSEAMWKRAAYLMQPSFLRELGISPFAAASAPSNAMVLYAGGYIVVMLALALYLFERRDL